MHCGSALNALRSKEPYTKCVIRLTISALVLHSVVSELREEPVLLTRPVSGCAGWLAVTITLLAHIEGAQISSSPGWKRAGASAVRLNHCAVWQPMVLPGPDLRDPDSREGEHTASKLLLAHRVNAVRHIMRQPFQSDDMLLHQDEVDRRTEQSGSTCRVQALHAVYSRSGRAG